MLIGGIVLAIAAPATVTWQSKSEVLARKAIGSFGRMELKK